MKTKRYVATLVAVLGAGLALAGCGSSGAASGADGASADLTAWFMRDDVPESAQQWLKDEWAARHDGAELTIEIQDWDGIITKLQTTLASESQTPDLVEFGNSQAITFTSVGALSDISDLREQMGGDDLVTSLLDSGTYEDTLYAAPFFAGSRIVFYRKSMFEAAGIEVPTTLAEVGEAAKALHAANPHGVDGFEGFFLPGKEFGTSLGWFFTNGCEIAEPDGDGWKATLSTPECQTALEQLQDIYLNAETTAASATVDEGRQSYVPFNEGRTGMFAALHRSYDKIDDSIKDDTGFFALPGLRDGETGRAFAGGSVVGIPAMSPNQELARELLLMTFEEEFQTAFATQDAGWVPGNASFAGPLEATEIGAVEVAAVENSAMTPAATNWGVVEGEDVIRDMLTEVATGADIAQIATEYDKRINDILNK